MSKIRADHTGSRFPDGGADLLTRLAQDEEWEQLVEVLDTGWAELIAEHPGAVRDAIASLPASVLESHPRWAIAGEYVNRMMGGPTTTRYRGIMPPSAPAGLLDALAQLTARAAAARADGRLHEAQKAAQEARDLLEESSVEAREHLSQALPELQFQWAMVWEYAGDADRAIREYVDSFDGALVTGNEMTHTVAAGALAWIHTLAGRNVQARDWLARLSEDSGQWWSQRSAVPVLLAETLLLIDEFRFPEAREMLSRIDLAGAPERWPFQKLLVSLITTDPSEAVTALSDIETSSVGMPAGQMRGGTIGAVVAIARSALFTATNHLAQARAALMLPTADRGTLAGQILYCMRAFAEARAGRYAAAARLVSPLRGTALSAPRASIAVLAITAAHDLNAGAEKSAVEQFRMAAAVANQNRSYYPLVLLPAKDLARLLELCPDALPPVIAQSLRALTPVTDADPFAALTAKEQRVLAVVLAGKNVTQTAQELYVSANTVKSHLQSIYRKTGVNSRQALDELAIRYGHHPGG